MRWLWIGAAVLLVALIPVHRWSRAQRRASIRDPAEAEDTVATSHAERDPESNAEPAARRRRVVASLRFGGRIFLGREISDLNGIAAAIRACGARTVVLHVDESVRAEQLFAVLGALDELGVRAVRLGTGTDMLDVTLRSPFWERPTGPLGHRPALLTVWIPATEPAAGLDDLRSRADSIRASGVRPLGRVAVQCAVPFHRLARVLRAFAAANTEIELGWSRLSHEMWSIHDLPESPVDAEYWIGPVEGSCACRYAAVDLPCAVEAEQDRDNDPDDRIALTIGASGSIWFRDRPRSRGAATVT